MRKLPLRLVISLMLVVLTFAVFAQVLRHDFIIYDDNKYVTGNPMVKDGLTVPGMIQAFRSTQAANWHPLTWISHMADVRIFGLDPAGHHSTSLLLHAANAVLLFLLLSRMTGSVWRSGFVAALFAVHPLHVESVAWVAERKDVLSTLFWILTMWAYVRYAEFKVQGSRFKVGAYVSVIVLFALGLMARPMLVTLPFVLLLLDYWPLGRFGASPHPNPLPLRGCTGEGARIPSPVRESANGTGEGKGEGSGFRVTRYSLLVTEKIPLFVLSLLSSAITYLVQQHGEAVRSLDKVPFGARAANAAVSYVAYIAKMLWPRDLAILYPHPVDLRPAWVVAGAALILVLLTALIIHASRSRPYLGVGWLWYLGTLVPVIGLVQVGSQAMADRYTYIPLIGLFVILAWGIPDLVCSGNPKSKIQNPKSLLPVISLLALAALALCTWTQVRYWKDTSSIFTRALAVTRHNAVAHNTLGIELDRRGETDEAIAHYERALEIKPDYVNAHNNLAIVLFLKGDYAGAWEHVELCRKYGGSPHPDFVEALMQRMR